MSRIGKINAIQGLRGVAALLVVVDHSLLRVARKTAVDSSIDPTLIRLAETLGRHGVEIFFLISGFVMTIASYEDFAQPRAAPRFLWRRIVRIVPLYWLITALVVAGLVWHGHPPQLLRVAESLAFVPYENDGGLFQPLLNRGWTLNYEMFFYALFALALFQTAVRGLLTVIATILALTLLGPLVIPADCTARGCALAGFYVQPIMLYFVGGILLGMLRLALRRRHRMPAVAFDNGLGIAVAATAAYGVYVGSVPPTTFSYGVGVLFCVLATAVCALLGDEVEHGPVRLAFLAVGEASYSIYLTHTLVIDPISQFWGNRFGRQWLGPYLMLDVVAASLLGLACYRWVEKPALRAFRRYL